MKTVIALLFGALLTAAAVARGGADPLSGGTASAPSAQAGAKEAGVDEAVLQAPRSTFYEDTGLPVPKGRAIRLDQLYADEEINERNRQERVRILTFMKKGKVAPK